MSKNLVKKSLILYGNVKKNLKPDLEFYNYSKKIISDLGFIPNYLGIESKIFKSGKILPIQKAEIKLLDAIQKGEKLDSLNILSLPDNFQQAIFDYNVSIIMYKTFEQEYISLTVNEPKCLSRINVDETINNLKNYLDFINGEIVEMSCEETLLNYVLKGKPASDFKLFKRLKTF